MTNLQEKKVSKILTMLGNRPTNGMNIKVILDKEVPLPAELTSTFPKQNKP